MSKEKMTNKKNRAFKNTKTNQNASQPFTLAQMIAKSQNSDFFSPKKEREKNSLIWNSLLFHWHVFIRNYHYARYTCIYLSCARVFSLIFFGWSWVLVCWCANGFHLCMDARVNMSACMSHCGSLFPSNAIIFTDHRPNIVISSFEFLWLPRQKLKL